MRGIAAFVAAQLQEKAVRADIVLRDGAILVRVLVFKDVTFYLRADGDSDSPIEAYYAESFPDERPIPITLAVLEHQQQAVQIETAILKAIDEFIATFREDGRARSREVRSLIGTSVAVEAEGAHSRQGFAFDAYGCLVAAAESHSFVFDDYGQIEVLAPPQPAVPRWSRPNEGASTQQDGTVRRSRPNVIRYLDVDYPPEGRVGQVQVLRVKVLCQAASHISQIQLRVDSWAIRTGEIPVDFSLRFDPADFECTGPCVQRVAVPLDSDAAPVIFRLIPRSAGHKVLVVDIYQGSSYVGGIQVSTVIEHSIRPPRPPMPRGFNLLSEDSGPDLSLFVEATGDPRVRQTFRYKLISRRDLGFYHRDVGEMQIDRPYAYLEAIRSELNAAASHDDESALLNRRLAHIGSDFYDKLFPDEMKRQYWGILHDQVTTMQIVSNESSIPWELLKPWRELPNGTIQEDEFLCERFLLTRWRAGHFACDILPLRRIGLLWDDGLPYVREEIAALRGIPGWQSEELALDQAGIYDLLSNGGFDGIHFACHGEFSPDNPDQSVLFLREGGRLRPSDIVGQMRGFGRDRPLIFLNTCEAAHQGPALTGLGGWASRFLDAGGAAFIGPAWEANSRSAGAFSKAFYHHFRQNREPMAEAIRLSREAIREDGNPTWLSYVVYAHPMARVQEVL